MTMFITAYDKQTGKEIRVIQLHIDSEEVKNPFFLDDFGPQFVNLMVQADGDELEWIKLIFDGRIPYANGRRVQRFYGDFAAMIVLNL